jgi:peptidoglycan/xylan/chitin deacetylase (PgdA/CDA1 family)
VKATFFTLGWVAERYPQLVRDIVAGGHELASHGYGHQRASDRAAGLQPGHHTCQKLLGDLSGGPVKNYRAPSFPSAPATSGPLMR